MKTYLKQVYQQLIENPKPSFFQKLLLFSLSLLEIVMKGLIWVRLFFYKEGFFRQHALPFPVISIGNLTLGGTGKTPLVEMLARQFSKEGKQVGILTRGYGRKSAATPSVVDFQKITSLSTQARQWGDEPVLLARQLPTVEVCVGKDRVAAAQKLMAEKQPHLFLLDDGFQHLRLKRDVNLVVIDGEKGFGNFHVFPRGYLREPLSQIKRADAIIFTQSSPSESLRLRVEREALSLPVFYSTLQCEYIEEMSGKQFACSEFQNKPLFLFSGIGNPKNFEKTVQQLGGNIVGVSHFPDHHFFSEKELKALFDLAYQKHAFALLTTEKDRMRIDTSFEFPLPLYFLKISAHCPELFTWLNSYCK